MDGLIDRIADFTLSAISKRADIAIDKGKRRIAHILIFTFLLILFSMGIYAVYSLFKTVMQ